MSYPSDLVRTKDWGTEVLYDTDLEGQLDLIIAWVMAALNNTSGHKHAGGANDGPPINPINGMVITNQALGDLLVATSASAWGRLALGTALQQLRVNAGATALEYFTPTVIAGVPTGTIMMWGGALASPPSGWLLCDGSMVSTTTYADLYAICGSLFGTPSGGNFKLPNFTNAFPYGASEGSAAGNASVGSRKVVSANNYDITGNDNDVRQTFHGGSGYGGGDVGNPYPQFDSMAPYAAIGFIIKT